MFHGVYKTTPCYFRNFSYSLFSCSIHSSVSYSIISHKDHFIVFKFLLFFKFPRSIEDNGANFLYCNANHPNFHIFSIFIFLSFPSLLLPSLLRRALVSLGRPERLYSPSRPGEDPSIPPLGSQGSLSIPLGVQILRILGYAGTPRVPPVPSNQYRTPGHHSSPPPLTHTLHTMSDAPAQPPAEVEGVR